MAGKLYLCATPIGNLEDITLRVLRVLKEVDMIAAEDTRHSIKLLNHYEIKTPLTSYHEHNKTDKGMYLVKQMESGLDIALVTDAGTPAVSDPGEDLVKLCYEKGIQVTSLPGPAALVTAMTLSGLSCRRFCFEGFLPVDKKERERVLEELERETRTIVLYEAPHRLLKTLKLLCEALGNRNATVCRELTKKHETAFCSTLAESIQYYEQNEPKGECVVVIEGKAPEKVKEEKIEEWNRYTVEQHIEHYMVQGHEKKEAMKLVAKDRGITKREVYAYTISYNNAEGMGTKSSHLKSESGIHSPILED